MTHDEAVAEITRRCWALGVYVLMAPKKHVDLGDGALCSGSFDDSGEYPLLSLATDKPKEAWLKIFLHEYGHATQWAENMPLWREHGKSASWTEWLAGRPVRNIEKAIELSRELEADCERRTIRLIKELGVDIDIEQYSRAANAYIHFYNFMLVNRQWFHKDRAPYKVAEVMAAANPVLDSDFSKTPKALMKALELCIEPNKKAKG